MSFFASPTILSRSLTSLLIFNLCLLLCSHILSDQSLRFLRQHHIVIHHSIEPWAIPLSYLALHPLEWISAPKNPCKMLSKF